MPNRKEQIFDCTKFGELLRENRKEQGYKSTKDFGAAIFKKTGLSINQETLARYERGERKPDIEQFLAIVITLSKNDTPESWAQGLTTEIYRSCLDGKPYLFKLSRSILAISQGLEIIERKVASNTLKNDPFEESGWRVRAYLERLTEIKSRISKLGDYATELKDLSISQEVVQDLIDRATVLLPAFNE